LPRTPATVTTTRQRSRTSSLDGVNWSTTDSDRLAKVAQVDPDGIPVIPVAYHEQRIGELKTAMRNEQLIVIGQRKQVVDEQMECDGVQSLFL
jgi:hypothetical protein